MPYMSAYRIVSAFFNIETSSLKPLITSGQIRLRGKSANSITLLAQPKDLGYNERLNFGCNPRDLNPLPPYTLPSLIDLSSFNNVAVK